MDIEQRNAEVRYLVRSRHVDSAMSRAGISLPSLRLPPEVARLRFANPRAWARALSEDGLISIGQRREFERQLGRLNVARGIDPRAQNDLGLGGLRFLGVDRRALRVALKRERDACRAVVCYARADIARVEPIVERLRVDGVSTWRDDDDIVLGDDWRGAIREAIGAGGPLLVFATHLLLGREVPKDEIALAETRNVRIIVLELDHGLDLSLLSLRLDRLQTAKWFEDESKAYRKLLHALRRQGGAART